MKRALRFAVATAALVFATPSYSEIISAESSESQGTLVHANGGSADVGEQVDGQLGAPSQGGAAVYFNGVTSQDGSDFLRMNSGAGQAELTANLNTATTSPTDTFLITSLDIFMDPGTTFQWIELALAGTGTVTFTLTDALGTDFLFDPVALVSGENKFAFRAINGQSISNLSFEVADGGVDAVRQVRIDLLSGAIPEPAVWAMMLFGFGAIGSAMRRRSARPAVHFS